MANADDTFPLGFEARRTPTLRARQLPENDLRNRNLAYGSPV